MHGSYFILRAAIALVLLTHGIPSFFNGGIRGFGAYLDEAGLAPAGLVLAIAVKALHCICAGALLADKCVMKCCGITIAILLAGIVMVHFEHGWYVVGGGTNGIEYNVVLIFVLAAIMLQKKEIAKNTTGNQ